MEHKQLIDQIKEWNANRLDLFEISFPDEKLEFFGVIRFFYQDDDGKYQSKCIRVSNRASASYLVTILIQKFHPDLRMLAIDKYALYENHSSGEDRRLEDDECPLMRQLNWAKDDREGKFILKNETRLRSMANVPNAQRNNGGLPLPMRSSTKDRRHSRSDADLSRIGKSETPKLEKKRTQEEGVISSGSFARRWSSSKRKNKDREQAKITAALKRAEELADKPPDSSFTRTLSNSEAVMKRRRREKLESKLRKFANENGNSDAGGTLKIYGDKLDNKVPYKTLLMSVNEPASSILEQILEKYGLDPRSRHKYCLIQVYLEPGEYRGNTKPYSQYRLRDTDCPMGILLYDAPARGHYIFQVDQRSDDIPLRPTPMPAGMNRSQSVGSLAPAERRSGKDSGNHQPTTLEALPSRPPSRNGLSSNVKLSHMVPYLDEVRADGSKKVHGRVHRLSSLVPPSVMANTSASMTNLSVLGNHSTAPVRIGSQLESVGSPPGIVISSSDANDILPLHCIIQRGGDGEGPLEIVPIVPDIPVGSAPGQRRKHCAQVAVNHDVITGPTLLTSGAIISLGSTGHHRFRLVDPWFDRVSWRWWHRWDLEAFTPPTLWFPQ